MGWFKEAWAEVRAALGVRRYVIGGLVTLVLTVAAAIYDRITGAEMGAMLSVLIAFLVIAIFILIAVVDHAVRLRRMITPKLELSFDATGGCLVQTPIKIKDGNEIIKEVTGVYLRVKVRNLGRIAAKECEPYLINVQKRRADGSFEDTDFHDAMDLPWSLREARGGFMPMTIGTNVRRYFDLLSCRSDNGKLELCGVWPLRLRDLFLDKGTYKLEVGVMGDGATATAFICIEWNGKWDEIKAYATAD